MLHLREIRKKRGLTMKEVGSRVGVTESAIGMYETGRRYPNYEMLLKLSEVLSCTVEDLITDAVRDPENGIKPDPAWDRLDKELMARLTALTPQEQSKVDAFVQGILAGRAE